MAELSTTNQSVEKAGGSIADYSITNLGQNYYRFPFLTGDNIDNGDTFETGGLRITACAWTAVNSGDYVLVEPQGGKGGSVVAFTTSGSNHNGVLHVWAEN